MGVKKKSREVTNSSRDREGRFCFRHGGLKLAISLLVAFLLALALIRAAEWAYANYGSAEIVSPVPESYPVSPSERRDTTATVIDRWLREHGSPLAGMGEAFYDAEARHNLPRYLLAAVAMAESSAGKHYHKATNNFMGWGKGKVVFKDKYDCVDTVAAKIASLPYYEDFRQSGSIGDFCLAYNAPEAGRYCKAIRGFMRELREGEMEL